MNHRKHAGSVVIAKAGTGAAMEVGPALRSVVRVVAPSCRSWSGTRPPGHRDRCQAVQGWVGTWWWLVSRAERAGLRDGRDRQRSARDSFEVCVGSPQINHAARMQRVTP